MDISELTKNLSIILSAMAFISGIRAWKREYIGKRKIELAEDTLMLFYQARDAIQHVRNPFSAQHEGSTREKNENENIEETELLNRAYIVYERYQKYEDVFNKIQATKYRFIARFGTNTEEVFSELAKILNDIFISARMLGTYYWKRQGRVKMSDEEFKKHLKEMHDYEATFWYMGVDNDKIGERVNRTLARMEKVTRTYLQEKDFWNRPLHFPWPKKKDRILA